MNNEEFLAKMKYKYESIQYFSVQNGLLTLNYQGIYTIPFANVTLSNLNENLFLLDPNEIFHTLYMLELLPKPLLNPYEEEFITNYVKRYLQYNDQALECSYNLQNPCHAHKVHKDYPMWRAYSLTDSERFYRTYDMCRQFCGYGYREFHCP